MPPVMKAHIVIKNSEGKIVKEFNQPLNSYIQGFFKTLRCLWNGTTDVIKDTSGTDRSVVLFGGGSSAFYTGLVANAGAGVDTFGVLVGTSTTAISPSDYNLNAKIAHGVSSGQLQYGACSVGTVGVLSDKCLFTMSRTFTNSSGADITVEEVGFGVAWRYGSTTYYYFLCEHSILNFTIANGENATVTYTLEVDT